MSSRFRTLAFSTPALAADSSPGIWPTQAGAQLPGARSLMCALAWGSEAPNERGWPPAHVVRGGALAVPRSVDRALWLVGYLFSNDYVLALDAEPNPRTQAQEELQKLGSNPHPDGTARRWRQHAADELAAARFSDEVLTLQLTFMASQAVRQYTMEGVGIAHRVHAAPVLHVVGDRPHEDPVLAATLAEDGGVTFADDGL